MKTTNDQLNAQHILLQIDECISDLEDIGFELGEILEGMTEYLEILEDIYYSED